MTMIMCVDMLMCGPVLWCAVVCNSVYLYGCDHVHACVLCELSVIV